ncbi:unnamed protein product [Schistosoma margrebowiei]|uniref:Uncharacterized protein n=1 Tax=Schistosoma margrebowiei TaxID=48269 RepID=A0A183N6C4_9TREM|nr:unnamed protein product [Schistosoma margrebowiei]
MRLCCKMRPPIMTVNHQRRRSISNEWRPNRVRREWCDEPANVEVTSHGQHLTWVTPLTDQSTIAALKTVQHKGRYYRNILVKLDTSENSRKRKKKAAINTSRTRAEKAKVQAEYTEQQSTVRESKPDLSGGRNQEEALEVDRTHIEESTQLRHKTSRHMESSRPKEKRKTKELITPENGDRHEKNEQESDEIRKEGPGQSGLENAGRRPMLH